MNGKPPSQQTLQNAHSSGAFPIRDSDLGISQWDYFAAAALSGLLANSARIGSPNEVAEAACRFADAMIEQRDVRMSELPR